MCLYFAICWKPMRQLHTLHLARDAYSCLFITKSQKASYTRFMYYKINAKRKLNIKIYYISWVLKDTRLVVSKGVLVLCRDQTLQSRSVYTHVENAPRLFCMFKGQWVLTEEKLSCQRVRHKHNCRSAISAMRYII